MKIERVPVPRWVLGEEPSEATLAALGDQPEWNVAIPWLHRALASPATHEPAPAAPGHQDESAYPGATAYWAPLLYMLIFSLGWTRPDRGLRWWVENGKPIGDPRLELLAGVWDADGQLDWFRAWLWTARGQLAEALNRLTALTGHSIDDTQRADDADPMLDAISDALHARTPNPVTGGTDPLHLTVHAAWPLAKAPTAGLLVTTDPASRRAVLLLDSMVGWYHALAERGAELPDLGKRSWHVDVVVRPTGCLGTYRRSRVTGLWFSGRHRFHTVGV